MLGKLLGNRYEILEQLGGGGMAIVYKGRDTFLNRLVTVKILRPEFTCDEDFVSRFRREAQAVASLSHPNIVSIFDVGRENDVHYLVMEYVEGDNLKNLIRAEGALPQEQVVQIAWQVGEALQHAHENNIVHRDVKPQNILITASGRAKLTDFGIARETTAATLTQTDTVLGSVHYLSPEQARGETADQRSDLYSLGIVMYEMATGVLPFQGETPVGVALKHIREVPALPSSLNPSVSPGLERIINRAMAKNIAGRYGTAQVLLTDLEGLTSRVVRDSGAMAQLDEFATRVITPVKNDAEYVPPAKRALPGPKKRRPVWLWGTLLALFLIAAAYATFQLYVNVPEIQMPHVEGSTLEEARAALMREGFKNIQETRNNHPTVPPEKVISQDPPPETMVKVTRNITLTVSKGPEYRTVPEVIGYTVSDARIKINQHELNVAEPPQERYSNDYPVGVVVDQNPGANTNLSKYSGVTLYVSKGPQPVLHQLPRLIGLTEEQARKELEKIKVKIDDNIIRATSADYMQGQIISQNIPGGTEVEEGSSVQITVSNGPGPESSLARIEVLIPDDGKRHELRIIVNDIRGSNEAYKREYPPDRRVVREVPYFGKAVIQVYIDEVLAGEQTFG
ncbi:MAG: Serine/threonine-protein kinase PrkC [Firmicutes bacterium ADurb.Bin456]|nr:MAG: Serine/threonine-protein kinase PrkC [Firmicutes bacterium ADurb.Bin456]